MIRWTLLAFVLALFVPPLTPGSKPETNGESLNRIVNNKLAANRIANNRLAGNKLAGNKIALNKMSANGENLNGTSAGDVTPLVLVRAVRLADGRLLTIE